MSLEVKIILSAIGVFALAFIVLWLIPVLMDGRRLRRERKKAEHRRRVVRYEEAQAEANRTGKPVIIDDKEETKTWPGPPATA